MPASFGLRSDLNKDLLYSGNGAKVYLPTLVVLIKDGVILI